MGFPPFISYLKNDRHPEKPGCFSFSLCFKKRARCFLTWSRAFSRGAVLCHTAPWLVTPRGALWRGAVLCSPRAAPCLGQPTPRGALIHTRWAWSRTRCFVTRLRALSFAARFACLRPAPCRSPRLVTRHALSLTRVLTIECPSLHLFGFFFWQDRSRVTGQEVPFFHVQGLWSAHGVDVGASKESGYGLAGKSESVCKGIFNGFSFLTEGGFGQFEKDFRVFHQGIGMHFNFDD